MIILYFHFLEEEKGQYNMIYCIMTCSGKIGIVVFRAPKGLALNSMGKRG